ncbi:MAG: hypothetical protein ACREHD_03290 [Pirellulales bacterium]
MTKPIRPWRRVTSWAAAASVMLVAETAGAQLPGAEPAGPGMAWQVAALFTANWVLAAVAVAILSRPTKRTDKPKKIIEEEA